MITPAAADTSKGLPRKAAHVEVQTKTMEHNPNNRLFLFTAFINLLAMLNPQTLMICLGIVSTLITIAHNGWKFYRDLTTKK